MRLTRLRILLAFVAATAVLFGVAAASAQSSPARRHWRPPPPQPAFSLALEDGMGNPLRSFQHAGQTWVLGEPGQRFVVVVRNPTPRRVEAVVSVDGRDAVNGRVASFERHRGYIVPAHGSVRIEGFRQSLDQVATFRFTSPGDSYSARMGTPQNLGVIGVAIFGERQRPAVVRRAPGRADKSAPRSAARSRDAESNLGTEFGESRLSQVSEVFFERASQRPARLLTLRYDDARGLLARGIRVFDSDRVFVQRVSGPQAFPDSRFAPPPRPR